MAYLSKMYCRTYQSIVRLGVRFINWTPPEIISGVGSIKKLPGMMVDKGMKHPLIVTDKGLMGLHLLDSLFEGLKARGIAYTVYDGVQPNPTIDNIEQARKLYAGEHCDSFIAFGGGSPMDCAKAAAARITRPGKSVPQMKGLLKVRKKLPPFIAVPTTAGTGSETTIVAVVSNPETHEKYAVSDPVLRPKYAVLDPELTFALPPHITSTTGMDALTHAVEAYIGRSNTKETEEYALKAVKLIFDSIYTAYSEGNNAGARENMLLASHYAGIAFTRANVGYVHAIAHSLGGMYGVPHGLANAVILAPVLEYYGASAYKRLARLAECAELGGGSDRDKALAFIKAVKELNSRMGIPAVIDIIKKSDIPVIAKRVIKEGNPFYPVPKIMSLSECETILENLSV